MVSNKNNIFIVYKKLLNFSFFFFNVKKKRLTYSLSINFFKIIKILFYINNFKIFIKNNFDFYDNVFIPFWINGFVTNFNSSKWIFFKKLRIKKLPNILINLTGNCVIDIEIQKKKLPLINLNNMDENINADYFITDMYSLDYNCLDHTFFFVLLFKSFKDYRNV